MVTRDGFTIDNLQRVWHVNDDKLTLYRKSDVQNKTIHISDCYANKMPAQLALADDLRTRIRFLDGAIDKTLYTNNKEKLQELRALKSTATRLLKQIQDGLINSILVLRYTKIGEINESISAV